MPTNEQRRATAKRKLERQLERRAKRHAGGASSRSSARWSACSWWSPPCFDLLFLKDDSEPRPRLGRTEHSTGGADVAAGRRGQLPASRTRRSGLELPIPGRRRRPQAQVNPPRAGAVPTDPPQISASMTTNQGNIGLQLYNAKAPCTVNSFASLAQQGYFNDTLCHRLTTIAGLRSCSAAIRAARAPADPATSSTTSTPPTSTSPTIRRLQSR